MSINRQIQTSAVVGVMPAPPTMEEGVISKNLAFRERG